MSLQKPDQTVVPINPTSKSFMEDPYFENVKNKASKWLAINPDNNISDMDSVFFNQDRFELMMDTRGYKPEEVKCIVSPEIVEIRAERQEQGPKSQRCVATTRSYQLPQNVLPQEAVCCLSSEGFLLLTVPWQK